MLAEKVFVWSGITGNIFVDIVMQNAATNLDSDPNLYQIYGDWWIIQSTLMRIWHFDMFQHRRHFQTNYLDLKVWVAIEKSICYLQNIHSISYIYSDDSYHCNMHTTITIYKVTNQRTFLVCLLQRPWCTIGVHIKNLKDAEATFGCFGLDVDHKC